MTQLKAGLGLLSFLCCSLWISLALVTSELWIGGDGHMRACAQLLAYDLLSLLCRFSRFGPSLVRCGRY